MERFTVDGKPMEPGPATPCPYCGMWVERGAKFCGNCGKPVPADSGAAHVGRRLVRPDRGGKTAKSGKPIYKRWWVWVLVAFFGLGALGGLLEEDGTADAPERGAEESPAVAQGVRPHKEETMEDKLEALFLDGEEMEAENTEVRYVADTGYASVSFTARAAAWDETAFLRDCLSCYVNFCRAAYELDGVNDVFLCIFTEMTDSRGNSQDEAVFKMEMPRDAFQQYDWENMAYRSGTFEQIKADCVLLDVHAGILSRAETEKIFYVP